MTRVATVLYEDSQGPGGRFGLHELVLALVADRLESDGASRHERMARLRQCVDGQPKKGVGNVITDLGRTGLIAGSGVLAVVVDRDRIHEHLHLGSDATDDRIARSLAELSDAPDRLWVHFLVPNQEGLLRSVGECDGRAPPARKKRNERDVFLNSITWSALTAHRDCVRGKQESVGALADRLAELVLRGGIADLGTLRTD